MENNLPLTSTPHFTFIFVTEWQLWTSNKGTLSCRNNKVSVIQWKRTWIRRVENNLWKLFFSCVSAVGCEPIPSRYNRNERFKLTQGHIGMTLLLWQFKSTSFIPPHPYVTHKEPRYSPMAQVYMTIHVTLVHKVSIIHIEDMVQGSDAAGTETKWAKLAWQWLLWQSWTNQGSWRYHKNSTENTLRKTPKAKLSRVLSRHRFSTVKASTGSLKSLLRARPTSKLL